jgi:aminomethyltransferase
MKETPLTNVHLSLGAKMAEFAGYNMPISYVGVKDEHMAVRNTVGVFDVSHMGEFIYKGEGAEALIQKVTSNDVSKLVPGQAQYSCLPNGEGGIIDDLLVYKLQDGNWMLVVNASNIEKDWNWIESHNDGVESFNVSDKTALLAVQGPKAIEVLQPHVDYDLSKIEYYHFHKADFAGIEKVLVSNTGYTGSGGFEIYFDNKDATPIWNAVMESGAEFNIQPCGLAARDTLRLEMGFCLYGNDIGDQTSPLEAGLGWITKLKNEENQFTGRDKVLALKQAGIKRRLVGFELIDRGIPRKDYEITNAEGNHIGIVTSGTMGPAVEKAIGMGYVEVGHHTPGSEIFIEVRGKLLKAEVVRPPFYKVPAAQ